MSDRPRFLPILIASFLIGILMGYIIHAFQMYQQNPIREFQDMFPGSFQIIVTALAGAIGLIFGRYIYDRYTRPNLEIVDTDELEIPQSPHVKWVRVIVRNRGRSAAENCIGHIKISGRYSNGEEIDIKGDVCWSIVGNPYFRTINVDDDPTLDIYRLRILPNNQNYFDVPSEVGYNRLRALKSINAFSETAQIEIRITSRNAKSCSENYILEFKENSVSMRLPENQDKLKR